MPVRFEALLAFMGTLLCSGLAIGVLYKKPHALVHRSFALGMLVLAIRESLLRLGAQARLRLVALHWQQLGSMVTTMLPGSWLLFSLSFARSNYRDFLDKWKWAVVGALALPLVVVAVFGSAILLSPAAVDS